MVDRRMKLYYVLVEDYGLYVFSADSILNACYHVEDVFPQHEFKPENIIELDHLTGIDLEGNWVTLVPKRNQHDSSNWTRTSRT